MLASSGFRDEPPLAHPDRQEGLSERVVDLVGSGVEEILSFEIDARPAERLAESFGVVERCWAAGVLMEERLEFSSEGRIASRRHVRTFQFVEGGHDRFGDKLSPERSEVSGAMWEGLSSSHDEKIIITERVRSVKVRFVRGGAVAAQGLCEAAKFRFSSIRIPEEKIC